MSGPAAGRAWDVLAIGRACVDEVVEVDGYPPEDAKVPLLERLTEGGGQASTAACLVARLGGQAAFCGRLGDDEPGDFARRRMRAFGVDLSPAPPPRGRTPLAYCLVSRASGTRTIVYERAAWEPLSWPELGPNRVGRARCVLADPQAGHLLPELARCCRERSTLLVVDAEHAGEGWEATWGLADVLAGSESFVREAVPDAATPAEALREIGRRTRGRAVATFGVKGALALEGGKVAEIPAIRVEVRDTTGAGDAFHGALALGLARGRAFLDAVRYAVAAASLSCRGLGGRSFPDPVEVEAAAQSLGTR